MTDSEHGGRWLTDDPFVLNTVLLVAASSLAIALTSCLWHHIYNNDNASLSLNISTARSLVSAQKQPLSIPTSGLVQEQKDRKNTRSKERRRRGKNPFRDLLKGEKQSKAGKATDNAPSVDTLSNASAPSNDSASSSSRSQSPEPTADTLDLDCFASRTGVESNDENNVKDTIPSGDTSFTSPVTSPGDLSDHSALAMRSHTDHNRSHSCTPDSMTETDTQVNVSSASTIMGHASELAPSSPHTSAPCVPQSQDLQTPSTSWRSGESDCARTRLPVSKIDPSVQSLLPSAADSVEIASLDFSCAPSISASTDHSADGAGASIPPDSQGLTPPPRSPSPSERACRRSSTPVHLDVMAAETQLASLRGALEAAQLREEQLRVEAEQASKQRDEFCWRWNEDAGVWRRREAELQAQIHHLVQQVQVYAAAASYPSSGFSSPTSPHAHSSPRLQHHPLAPFPLPPAIQTQNSASPPAHVQALLASAPMLTSHPPGFAAPVPGGLYSGASLGMSPLLWSGIGLPHRDPRHGTPDLSVSGCWSRGRRRRRRAENVRSASDESSLGDLDGVEDGSEDEDGWEEEEDVFRNNALADAILKRPESIRDLSGSMRKRSGMGRNGVHGTVVLENPALKKHGFVPPSLVQ